MQQQKQPQQTKQNGERMPKSQRRPNARTAQGSQPAQNAAGATTAPAKWHITPESVKVSDVLLRTDAEKTLLKEVLRLTNIAICSDIAIFQLQARHEWLQFRSHREHKQITLYSRIDGTSHKHNVDGKFALQIAEVELRIAMLKSEVYAAVEKALQAFSDLLQGGQTSATVIHIDQLLPTLEIIPEYARQAVSEWSAQRSSAVHSTKRTTEDIVALTEWFVSMREQAVRTVNEQGQQIWEKARKRTEQAQKRQRTDSAPSDSEDTTEEDPEATALLQEIVGEQQQNAPPPQNTTTEAKPPPASPIITTRSKSKASMRQEQMQTREHTSTGDTANPQHAEVRSNAKAAQQSSVRQASNTATDPMHMKSQRPASNKGVAHVYVGGNEVWNRLQVELAGAQPAARLHSPKKGARGSLLQEAFSIDISNSGRKNTTSTAPTEQQPPQHSGGQAPSAGGQQA